MTSPQQNNSMTSQQRSIKSAANQSVRPYSSNEQYLYAMTEDLAEWLKVNYFIFYFIF